MLVSLSSRYDPIVFWELPWAVAQDCQALLVPFLPYLKPAASPKRPGSFYWEMAFRAHKPGLEVGTEGRAAPHPSQGQAALAGDLAASAFVAPVRGCLPIAESLGPMQQLHLVSTKPGLVGAYAPGRTGSVS